MSEGKLTTKQLKLLSAMFTEPTFAAACKKANIGQRTGKDTALCLYLFMNTN